MKDFEIHEEGNGKFATIKARTPESALNKAKRQFPRRACDYNGYVGPVEWTAFSPTERYSLASLTVCVK